MAYWHEALTNEISILFPPKRGGRVTARFRGQDIRKAPFQGYFLRFEGAGAVPVKTFTPWKQNPEGWFELWPLEPMLASSREEARSLFQPLLPYVEDGSRDDLFEKRPYEPPVVPRGVKEIEHPTHLAKARIARFPNGQYRVSYLVYDPDDRYFPVSTPSVSTDRDFQWGVLDVKDADGQKLQTMADDLASAETIALIELHQFVARDSEIKPRK